MRELRLSYEKEGKRKWTIFIRLIAWNKLLFGRVGEGKK